MKNLCYAIVAAALLAGTSGCCGDFWNHRWPWEHGCGCGDCHKSCGCDNAAPAGPAVAGPPTGAVAYPYYTNRGPRDFFSPNPTPIGP